MHAREVLVALVAVGVGLTTVSGCSSGGGSSSGTVPAGSSSPVGGAAATPRDHATGSGDGGTRAGSQPEPVATSVAPGLPSLAPDGRQTDVLRRLPGSASGGCVAVGDARDVRSGGLAAGPFDDARGQASSGDSEVRLYFVPEHARSMPGIVVSGRNTATGETFTRRQRSVADAEQFRLYDLELPVSAGTWLLRATAGPDSGCWTADLG